MVASRGAQGQPRTRRRSSSTGDAASLDTLLDGLLLRPVMGAQARRFEAKGSSGVQASSSAALGTLKTQQQRRQLRLVPGDRDEEGDVDDNDDEEEDEEEKEEGHGQGDWKNLWRS